MLGFDEEGRHAENLRCAQGKAGDDGELLGFAHLELPHGSDRKGEDEYIRYHVRHDERLEDEDLVHATSNTFQRPLLLDRVAKENEDKREDETPADDDCHAREDPILDVDCEDSHVEEQLAEFERGQGPEIDQGESEGDLAGQKMCVRRASGVITCMMYGMFTTTAMISEESQLSMDHSLRFGYTSKDGSKSTPTPATNTDALIPIVEDESTWSSQ